MISHQIAQFPALTFIFLTSNSLMLPEEPFSPPSARMSAIRCGLTDLPPWPLPERQRWYASAAAVLHCGANRQPEREGGRMPARRRLASRGGRCCSSNCAA